MAQPPSYSHCIILNCIQITLHYFQCQISTMSSVRAGYLFGDFKDWNMSVNFIPEYNIQLFWFLTDQCLKKVVFGPF